MAAGIPGRRLCYNQQEADMHITITGRTGSGKTTISKLIRDQLGYERYSTGEYQR